MLSRNEDKKYRSLLQKKYRKLHHAFIVEGEKSVAEVLTSELEVQHLILTEEHAAFADSITKIPVSYTDGNTMASLSALSTPPGLLAVVSIPEYHFDATKLGTITLVLDHLTDPGNLGTIIRTADWFGIYHILCSENTVEVFNPKVIQATMGSFTRVKVYPLPLAELLDRIKDQFEIYGMDMQGQPLEQAKSNKRKLIITGSESDGISKDLRYLIDKYISIPPYNKETGEAPESLNASIATAIACYALTRK